MSRSPYSVFVIHFRSLADTVAADIVGVLAQFVEISRCVLRGFSYSPRNFFLRPRLGAASGSS